MKNVLDRAIKSVEVKDFTSLKPGNHNVRLAKFAVVDSFDKNTAGDIKENLPEWQDATDQLFVTFVGKDGAISHRFNLQGYVKFSELTASEIKAKKVIDIKGYACIKNKDGNIVRIEDPAKTETALGIVDQFTSALDIPERTPLGEALENAINEKTELNIYVKEEVYNNKVQFKVGSFRHATASIM